MHKLAREGRPAADFRNKSHSLTFTAFPNRISSATTAFCCLSPRVLIPEFQLLHFAGAFQGKPSFILLLDSLPLFTAFPNSVTDVTSALCCLSPHCSISGNTPVYYSFVHYLKGIRNTGANIHYRLRTLVPTTSVLSFTKINMKRRLVSLQCSLISLSFILFFLASRKSSRLSSCGGKALLSVQQGSCGSSPHFSSPHVTSSHLTSPYLISPHLLTSSHLTSCQSVCLPVPAVLLCVCLARVYMLA